MPNSETVECRHPNDKITSNRPSVILRRMASNLNVARKSSIQSTHHDRRTNSTSLSRSITDSKKQNRKNPTASENEGPPLTAAGDWRSAGPLPYCIPTPPPFHSRQSPRLPNAEPCHAFSPSPPEMACPGSFHVAASLAQRPRAIVHALSAHTLHATGPYVTLQPRFAASIPTASVLGLLVST
jgi:hypothetical protein